MKDTVNHLIDAIEYFLKKDQDTIDWETKSSPDKWSKKEIIGHLIDSAQINLQRFVRCTFEENFKLIYQQNEWVTEQRYQDADIKELLDLWILLNRQIVRVLISYPADRSQSVCDTGKNEISLHTVEWLAADYVEHMKHHLDLI